MSKYLHETMPDQTYLAERLRWDDKKNTLVWLRRPLWQFLQKNSWKAFNATKAEQPAGHKSPGANVLVVSIDNVTYRQDHIVYILAHNKCPKFLLHVDGDPFNVSLDNLIPDPDKLDVFGNVPYIETVYFPMEYLRHLHGEERKNKRSPHRELTAGRAHSILDNLETHRAQVGAYPPKDYLDTCLSYNPETGELLWKTRPREHFTTAKSFLTTNTRRAGKPAGVKKFRQQTWVGIDKTSYKADILAFVLMGRPPPLWVVHTDNDASNIVWDNLVGIYEEDL